MVQFWITASSVSGEILPDHVFLQPGITNIQLVHIGFFFFFFLKMVKKWYFLWTYYWLTPLLLQLQMTSVVFVAQIRAEGLLQFKAWVIATKGFIFLFLFFNSSKFKNCKPCVCLSSLQHRVLYSTMVSEISPKSNKLHPYPSIKRWFVLQPGKAGLKLGTRNLFWTTRQLTSTMMEMFEAEQPSLICQKSNHAAFEWNGERKKKSVVRKWFTLTKVGRVAASRGNVRHPRGCEDNSTKQNLRAD